VLQQGHASLVKGKIHVPAITPQYPEPAVEAPVEPKKAKKAEEDDGSVRAE
jgi:hypothetical protein